MQQLQPRPLTEYRWAQITAQDIRDLQQYLLPRADESFVQAYLRRAAGDVRRQTLSFDEGILIGSVIAIMGEGAFAWVAPFWAFILASFAGLVLLVWLLIAVLGLFIDLEPGSRPSHYPDWQQHATAKWVWPWRTRR